MKNEKGFTLLEMLLVMVVISVLLLLIIPNVITQRSSVQGKGCDAYVKSVESQVQAYQLQHNKIPTIDELVNGKYITSATCPKGEPISISSDDGAVSVVKKS
ncbi:competence type IV pilus major pilin ComGC [Bacillus cereus]|uniref:competence type IV pilus major pilin ComGC n=1 Tax=Bacillus cereus TaxID=1396 RepID=UPI00356BE2E4